MRWTSTPQSVNTIKRGKIVRQQYYFDHAEALEAVGLREQAMSQENVEIVRRGYEALARGEVEAALEFSDRDLDFYQPDELAGGSGHYRGHEEFTRGMRDLQETFEEFHMVTERFIDAGGDYVVVFARLRGRGRESGVPIDEPVGHVLKLRDGKVVLLHAYNDRAEALEAVGLSEQDAHWRTSSS